MSRRRSKLLHVWRKEGVKEVSSGLREEEKKKEEGELVCSPGERSVEAFCPPAAT